MSGKWRRRWHGGARGLGWTAGVLVILFAVLAALAQLLLPLLARHPAWVAAQLSQRLQRPVSFASMQGRWTASGPEFVMHDVVVGPTPGASGAALRLPESRLRLDFGAWLLPSRHLVNLYARGLELDLLHDAGGWHVNGIGVGQGPDRQPLALGHWSVDLWLDDLRVVVTDAIQHKRYVLSSRQLRLSHQGNRIRFGGTLQRAGVAGASVRAVGEFRQDGRAGRVWFRVDDARLKPLLEGVDLAGYTIDQGGGRMSAWLDWRHGRLSSSLVRFDLDTLAVSTAAGGTAQVAALHGLAGVRDAGSGYEIRWAGDDGSAAVLRLDDPGTPQLRVEIAARRLQLAPLLPWLALEPDLSLPLARWLGTGHPRGELDHVSLRWTRASGLQQLAVGFERLAIDPVDNLPGVEDLHGELRGDGEAFSLELPVQATTVKAPRVFRDPFVLSKLAGTLAFWRQDDDWHLGADTLDFVGADYAGSARGEAVLPTNAGAPRLDLYATLDHADIRAAKLFWPIRVMPPGTVTWLNRALVSGRLEQARVVLRGDLADWPFNHHEGRFEAQAVIHDLSLDYGTDWPRAEGVDAVASFINGGMLVEANSGHALGVKVDHAVATIADFGQPVLDLKAQGSGSGSSLLTFASKSPVASQVADTLGKLRLGGQGNFDFHLSLPFNDSAGAQLDGTASLQGASLTAPEWKLDLENLNGPLHFDLHGLQGGPLDATLHGQASRLQFAIAGANTDPSTVVSAQLQGSYQLSELVQDYPSIDWLGRLGQGRSEFNIDFSITRQPGTEALTQKLSVDSALNGIALQLPAPLDKPAASTLPLHLTIGLPFEGSELQLGLGQLLQGRLRLADGAGQPLAGALMLGKQMPKSLPAQGLRIRGHAATLDVTGWVQQMTAGAGGGGPGLDSLDVDIDQAGWFGRPLGALALRAVPQSGVLSVDVKGPAMEGNFSVPTQDMDKRGVTVRLQHLYWPKDVAATKAERDAGQTGGKSAAAPVTSVAESDPANTGISPAALPPFHLWVGDLRLGDASLGEARLETWPTTSGLHIEQLRALSKRVQITANGDWNGSASDSYTHMRINFSAEDLGAMLGAFGFKGLVQGGKTHDQLDARWPGSPSALSLATMDGNLSIHVSDGRIPEATSPGVGRLLGLVSLAELPRRLTLDFGDVFGKGLGFDSITGDFRLANGNATTTNLVINGSAANISITGRTGLRRRDYDQQLLVVPHVGNSLPLVGAVVGGPIGAAAGFAVQGILGKGLNKAASARYHITGSWDDPVMTLIEKHGAPAASAPPPLEERGGNPADGSSAAPALPGLPARYSTIATPSTARSVQP
ncbi:MAG: YhdP family protein [Rhodanobacter sp.]